MLILKVLLISTIAPSDTDTVSLAFVLLVLSDGCTHGMCVHNLIYIILTHYCTLSCYSPKGPFAIRSLLVFASPLALAPIILPVMQPAIPALLLLL